MSEINREESMSHMKNEGDGRGPKRKRKMNAYYFNFRETGVDCVDDILEQIAHAGKAYHHTSHWHDRQDFLDNKSFAELIQEASSRASREYETLRSQRERLVELLENIENSANLALKDCDWKSVELIAKWAKSALAKGEST